MSKAKPPACVAPAPDLPRLLSIDQTAARLGYSRQTVALLIQEGRLRALNIALTPCKTRAVYRIPADAVVAPKFTTSSTHFA